MTQIDVLKMAIEAGLAEETSDGLHQIWYPDNLYHFAKLVAEAEREACAKICETLELPDWPDKVRQPLAQAIRARGQA